MHKLTPRMDAVPCTINNDLRRQDAQYFLEEYSKFLSLSNNEIILDVGTGDGSVLQDVILPKMPVGLKHIVALDFDEDILKLAERKLSNRSDIKFVCLPIETSDLPATFFKQFDQIFSFHCLHLALIDDILPVFKNLLSMLKPGGKMLLTIAAHHPCFAVCEEMATMDPWKRFMDDVSDFIIPYQHYEDPDKEIEKGLKTVGFVNYKCDLVKRTYTHRTERKFWEWAMGIDPFIGRIPSDLQNSYRNDYFKVMSRLDDFIIEYYPTGTPQEITVSYYMLVVYATAPV